MSRISSDEEVIGNFDKGSLSAVMCSEARLEGFIKSIMGHVLMKLGSDCSFQDFAHEGKVGDRTVVVEVIRVQTVLFKNNEGEL